MRDRDLVFEFTLAPFKALKLEFDMTFSPGSWNAQGSSVFLVDSLSLFRSLTKLEKPHICLKPSPGTYWHCKGLQKITSAEHGTTASYPLCSNNACLNPNLLPQDSCPHARDPYSPHLNHATSSNSMILTNMPIHPWSGDETAQPLQIATISGSGRQITEMLTR